MEQFESYLKDFHKIRNLIIFLNSFEEIRVSLKSDENNSTLQADQIYVYYHVSVPIRMREIFQTGLREN